MLTSAPFSSSSSTTSLWPHNEAQYIGVLRHCVCTDNWNKQQYRRTWHGLQTLSGMKTAAPALSNRHTTSTWPLREANSRAVCPFCKWWGYRDQWSSSQWTQSEMRIHIHYSREPHILSPGVDIDRSGEESQNCFHISSLSSIVELCSSLSI